ncbi:MAG: putative Calcium-chelating exported protein [Sedimentibacter sp.]|nr:putative Calcium-chelating exported protein [Sedimentibacter sp.]
MKNKVIALTLTALLAFSSTSAFAAEATKLESENYNNLKSYISEIIKGKLKVKSIKVNGKNVDLNSIDWNSLLNTAKTEKVTTEIEKPVVNLPQIQTPAKEQQTEAKPVENQLVAAKPAAQKVSPVKEENNTSTETAPVSTPNLSYEQKVVELVNIERQKAGLQALTLNSEISNVARTKAKDMAVNNYFAHQSPTYGSAGDMLTKFGIRWSAWGENLASGQRTPESVVTAWMNSEGHRANIMSPNFSRIGVGYVTNSSGTPYWTQVFTD